MYEVYTLLQDPVSYSIAPLVLGGLISAGGSILGGLMGNKSQSNANAANLKLAQYQNSWNEQMYERNLQDQKQLWNMQNEYNTPSAQMQRYSDAGLNPNLIYGQGSSGNATGLNAPSAPSAANMRVNPVDNPLIGVAGAAEKAQQFVSAYYQQQSLQADINLKDAETLNKLSSTPGIQANSRLAAVNADVQEVAKSDLIKQIQARTVELQANAKRSDFFSQDSMLQLDADLKQSNFNLRHEQLNNLAAATARLQQTKNFEAWEQDVIRTTGIKPGQHDWASLVVTLLKNFGMFDMLKHYFQP